MVCKYLSRKLVLGFQAFLSAILKGTHDDCAEEAKAPMAALTWLNPNIVLLTQEMQWEIHPTERALHGQEAQWWLPDADIKDIVIPVDSFKAILGHLREMPESEVSRKLQEMDHARHSFFFQVCLVCSSI